MNQTKGLLFTASLALALALTLTGCGPTLVRIEMERPPLFNTDCIKRIAIMPFEHDGKADYGSDLAARATASVTSQIQGMGLLTLVDDPSQADVILSGQITQINVTKYTGRTAAMVESKDYVSKSNNVYKMDTQVEFSYSFKMAKDGKVIGPFSRKGYSYDWSENDYPFEGFALNTALDNAIGYSPTISQSLAIYKSTEQRGLVEDKTGNKAIKKDMKEAAALAKAQDYKAALEAYLSIYEEHKSPAAALNAAILHQSLGDLKSALEMLKKATDEAGNPIMPYIPKYAEALSDIIEGRERLAASKQEEAAGCR